MQGTKTENHVQGLGRITIQKEKRKFEKKSMSVYVSFTYRALPERGPKEAAEHRGRVKV